MNELINEVMAFLHSKYGQRLAAMGVWMLVLMLATPAMAAMRRVVHHAGRSTPRATARGSARTLFANPNVRGVSRPRRHTSSYNPRSKRVSGRPVLPAGPQSDRVEEIQSALAQQGFYQGEPSGKWDDGTSEAMREFQQSSGITATGKLDAGSLQRLGLGSDVAGLNPPKPLLDPPPANSAANTPALAPKRLKLRQPQTLAESASKNSTASG